MFRTKFIAAKAVVVATVISMAAPALAAPKVSQSVKQYKVTATSIDGLIREMDKKGPKGHWAYTSWYVKWTGSCKVSVDVKYILPKHANPSAMPSDVRRKFDAMLKALTAHEKLHGNHGVLAGKEIEAGKCSNGDDIIKKYNRADIQLDKRTNHGIKDGATLK